MKTNQPEWLLFAAALAQPLCARFSELTGIGTRVGTAVRGLGAPEQPLPAFFAIWLVIFSGVFVFALVVLRNPEPWRLRVAKPLAFACVFNCVWMLAAQLIVSPLVDHVLLLPIVYFAYAAAHAFDQARGLGGSAAKIIADATTGLLAGWVTTAFAISGPLSVRALTSIGGTDRVWLMWWLTIVVAAIGAYFFTRFVSRSLWFFVALGWGLAGIAVSNWTVTQMHLLAIFTVISALTLIVLRVSRGAMGSRRSLA